MKTTLSKTLAIITATVLLAVGFAMTTIRAQAQSVNPYPSLYVPTATAFSMPAYFQTFGNGYDMFYQQISQFMSFLNGGSYFPVVNYGNSFGYNYSSSSSSSNDFDEPDVETDDAEHIDRHEAELNGEIDMNDAEDGIVFFVYGEDEDQIQDVEDDYDSYSDVDEDGDDLQKVKVETRFDGDDTFSEDVEDLDADTRHYFALCVEYEDEDGDETLTCGRVEEFRTDN